MSLWKIVFNIENYIMLQQLFQIFFLSFLNDAENVFRNIYWNAHAYALIG